MSCVVFQVRGWLQGADRRSRNPKSLTAKSNQRPCWYAAGAHVARVLPTRRASNPEACVQGLAHEESKQPRSMRPGPCPRGQQATQKHASRALPTRRASNPEAC
eukprot:1138864-Pelagomonas_calceolata.AAC.1